MRTLAVRQERSSADGALRRPKGSTHPTPQFQSFNAMADQISAKLKTESISPYAALRLH